jgi:hypothetical protein
MFITWRIEARVLHIFCSCVCARVLLGYWNFCCVVFVVVGGGGGGGGGCRPADAINFQFFTKRDLYMKMMFVTAVIKNYCLGVFDAYNLMEV